MACNQASLITLVLHGLLRAKTPLNNLDFKCNLSEEVHFKNLSKLTGFMGITADISLHAENSKKSVLKENNEEWQPPPISPLHFVFIFTLNRVRLRLMVHFYKRSFSNCCVLPQILQAAIPVGRFPAAPMKGRVWALPLTGHQLKLGPYEWGPLWQPY